MKILFLCLLLIASSSQDNYVTKVSSATNVLECTYWQGLESTVCITNNFEVTNNRLSDFKGSSLSTYSTFAEKQAATATLNDPTCFDDERFWTEGCPSAFTEQLYMRAASPTTEIVLDITTGSLKGACAETATENAKCQKTCNKCGSENYLTAPKTVKSRENDVCLAISYDYPFSCIDKRTVETYKPSIIAIEINKVAAMLPQLCPASGGIAAQLHCLSFRYRRRTNTIIRADSLTTLLFCSINSIGLVNNLEYDEYGFPEDCESAGSLTDSTAAITKAEIKTEHCDFNSWIEGRRTLQFDCAAATANQEIIQMFFRVERGVDHFDLDAITLTEGACENPPGTAIPFTVAKKTLDYEERVTS